MPRNHEWYAAGRRDALRDYVARLKAEVYGGPDHEDAFDTALELAGTMLREEDE